MPNGKGNGYDVFTLADGDGRLWHQRLQRLVGGDDKNLRNIFERAKANSAFTEPSADVDNYLTAYYESVEAWQRDPAKHEPMIWFRVRIEIIAMERHRIVMESELGRSSSTSSAAPPDTDIASVQQVISGRALRAEPRYTRQMHRSAR